MNIAIEIIETDFGPVQLSPKVKAYLDKVAPGRQSGRKPRSKKAKRQAVAHERVVQAAMTCAEIEFASGGQLETF